MAIEEIIDMKLNTFISFILLNLLFIHLSVAQPERWQQRAEYKMKIDFDVTKHQFTGEQELKYWNNSPDTLHKVFYHLYFNAFQPNSMMDVRSRTISDPSRKIMDRISKLSPDEIGYHRVTELKQDGKSLQFEVVGTILEVNLLKPIMPGKSTKLEMKFNSQVPVQIRRNGRDNAEGIDYSMSQWYPKLCEYDYQGWHANPYIGREFYGVWGDFEVEIEIDGRYTVAAGGVLQNADKMGRGYSDKEVKISDKKVKWKWKAENVHDFMWAADRDFKVNRLQSKHGPMIYTVYQPGEKTTDNWEKLPEIMDTALGYINRRYGRYPYPVYYFIQGGDGGMEYPMGTLITGERSLRSLVGVSIHEWMHSWYQMILGTNEALYAWMDEGFTSFASADIMNYLVAQKMIPGKLQDNPQLSAVRGLINFHMTGRSEALSTHSDHFITNASYGNGSYTKGRVFLEQLSYIIGEEALYKGLRRYFNTWKFKHPNDNDFIRIMEKTSGIELDWFREYFVNTTYYPNYAVANVSPSSDSTSTTVELARIGLMPMPIDLMISYKDGTKTYINIPLRIMRGSKPYFKDDVQYILAEDWPWTHPTYSIDIDYPISQIESIEIDPSQRMVDLDRSNNSWSSGEE